MGDPGQVGEEEGLGDAAGVVGGAVHVEAPLGEAELDQGLVMAGAPDVIHLKEEASWR